jgi:prepilin-type processing-associated H-X9-DG protein
LNKDGGEVNSAFVDGSVVSFSEFPVLPCCTLKKGGAREFISLWVISLI